VPGLTGWAQINGRDELPIPVKAQYDYEYLLRRSYKFDLYILLSQHSRAYAAMGFSIERQFSIEPMLALTSSYSGETL